MREVTVNAGPEDAVLGADYVVACPARCAPPEDGEDLVEWVAAVAASPFGLVVDGHRRCFEALGGLDCLHIVFCDEAEDTTSLVGPVLVDELQVALPDGRARCAFADVLEVRGRIQDVPAGTYVGAIHDLSAERRPRVEEAYLDRTTALARGLRRVAGIAGPVLACLTPLVVWLWVDSLGLAWPGATALTVAVTLGNWTLQLLGWARVFEVLGVDEARARAERLVPQARLLLVRVTTPAATRTT